MTRRPAPRFAFVLIAVLALAAAVAAVAQEAAVQGADASRIEGDLRLERKLLALDLAEYRQARTVEQRTREELTLALTRLDAALAGDAVALGTLELRHLELSTARAAARIAAERVERQLLRVEDRLLRIGFLEGELGRPVPASDAISGTWRVTLQPQGRTGTFEMRLNGALVTGSYRMEQGAAGSLRGTFADNDLRLERIDANRGFESVFRGILNPETGRLTGTWTATDLAGGQPAGGTWTATRTGAGNGNQP